MDAGVRRIDAREARAGHRRQPSLVRYAGLAIPGQAFARARDAQWHPANARAHPPMAYISTCVGAPCSRSSWRNSL
jgi:hypothetical protein